MERARVRVGWVVAALSLAGTAVASPPEVDLDRLKGHVETLASPEFGGRRGEGARKAEAYIAGHFRSLGLSPLFGDSYTQDVPGREPETLGGRNVGARVVGSDPDLKDEWIILSAHYDHLGVRGGRLYPGADDNASGVAMLLEAARLLAGGDLRPRRSLMLVAFDMEEEALWGSRHFANHPPVPLDRVALFATADLIGGALGGVCDRHVFVVGSEHAPGVRPWIDAEADGMPLSVGLLGADILMIDRSDYGPFRARKVPFLFFSTGETPRYHTPDDTPDRVDYPKLQAISRLILGVALRAADADDVPDWEAVPDHPLAEAVAIRDVLQILLDHRDDLAVKPPQAALMTGMIRQLDDILARGAITASERSRMVRVARVVLLSVL